MKARNLAKQASLANTEVRLEKAIAQQESERNRSTYLIAFQGVNASTGKAYGTKPDGSVVYFDLETNAIPLIGQSLEVAIARNTLFGKGDKRPVK